MNRIALFAAAALALTACAPSEVAIMAAISQTQANWTMVPPLPTLTPRPTYTPAPTIAIQVIVEVTRLVEITQTYTPTPLYTPTITPTPTETPLPTVTPNAEQTATAKALQKLRSPKGDGFYLVNEDIAPGVWRSNGDSSSCYWSVTRADGDIIDNHFGMAGGTAFISASAFQVEFNGCGRWEFISAP